MIKTAFHIALGALWGFITSLTKVLAIDFFHVVKGLQIPIRKRLKMGEKLNVIFDSRGVKVFGEREWKVRKYGYSKRVTWRQIHVGISPDLGQVVVRAMSSNSMSDEATRIYTGSASIFSAEDRLR